MHKYTGIHTYTLTNMHADIHTYIHTYIHAGRQAGQKDSQAAIHTYNTQIQKYTNTGLHTYTHKYRHKDTGIHEYIHMYVQSHCLLLFGGTQTTPIQTNPKHCGHCNVRAQFAPSGCGPGLRPTNPGCGMGGGESSYVWPKLGSTKQHRNQTHPVSHLGYVCPRHVRTPSGRNQAYIHTNRQTTRQQIPTSKQGHTVRQTYIHTHRQTDRQADRQAD